MQYYALMLNRTYLVLLNENYLIGLVANGLVSVKGGKDPLTYFITSKMSVDGSLDNPLSYLNGTYLGRYSDKDLLSNNIVHAHRANFRIKLNEIASVRYDPRKKWGMGYYPHDGKVLLETNGNKKEFIILGDQSGQGICDWLRKAIASAMQR